MPEITPQDETQSPRHHTGEIEITPAERQLSDRLWEVFVKALPVLVAALLGLYVQSAVHNAEQDYRLESCMERTASIEEIRTNQAVIMSQQNAITEDIKEVREAIRER